MYLIYNLQTGQCNFTEPYRGKWLLNYDADTSAPWIMAFEQSAAKWRRVDLGIEFGTFVSAKSAYFILQRLSVILKEGCNYSLCSSTEKTLVTISKL